jgi:hypothetical protein
MVSNFILVERNIQADRKHQDNFARARVAAGAGCETPSGTPVEKLKALCEPIAGFR